MSVVQCQQWKVLGPKGKRQIPALQAAQRGVLVTAVACLSPTSNYVPPLLIFPRNNMKMERINCTPTGSICACLPSDWIQSNIYINWSRHFIRHFKSTAGDPVILLDGHFSRVHNFEIVDLGRENHVYITYLSPHTTGKTQPLDLAFMGPLKRYYAQDIERWFRAHPHQVVIIYQVGALFGNTYMRESTTKNFACGFRKPGLCPFNSNIFRPHEFLIAEKN
jgi:hypothetical protein